MGTHGGRHHQGVSKRGIVFLKFTMRLVFLTTVALRNSKGLCEIIVCIVGMVIPIRCLGVKFCFCK